MCFSFVDGLLWHIPLRCFISHGTTFVDYNYPRNYHSNNYETENLKSSKEANYKRLLVELTTWTTCQILSVI